jgi:hypothetical protein
MNDQKQTGGNPSYSDVEDELRTLGKNIKEALQSVWLSDERKKLEDEIRAGLTDLGVTLNEAASELTQSETGQRLKEDVEDLRRRINAGEVESRVREELLNALRMANAELSKVSNKHSTTSTSESDSDADQNS